MEFLITYGWMILIVGLIAGSIFYIVFQSNFNSGPKAQPGSCQVFRPGGRGSTLQMGLQGECTGEEPEFVTAFDGSTNPAGFVSIPDSMPGSTAQTVTLWINPTVITGVQYLAYVEKGTTLYLDGAEVCYKIGGVNANGVCHVATDISKSKWTFVAFTYNGLYESVYLNGNLVQSIFTPGTPGLGSRDPQALAICTSCSPLSDAYNGLLSNVQLYNSSLSGNDLKSLYLEGIGGAPISLQFLSAWYPLNGGANDYSGNNYDGTINNVTFSDTWYSGYTPP